MKTNKEEKKEEERNPIWIIKLNSILNQKKEAKNASRMYKGNTDGKRNN